MLLAVAILLLLLTVFCYKNKLLTCNKKLLISEELKGGLANRLFGLSSNIIFSKLGGYNLSGIVIHILVS